MQLLSVRVRNLLLSKLQEHTPSGDSHVVCLIFTDCLGLLYVSVLFQIL